MQRPLKNVLERLLRPNLGNFGVLASVTKSLNLQIRALEVLLVARAFYEVLMREGYEVDAPEADKLFFREHLEPFRESVENRISRCLDTVGDYDLALRQQETRQHFDKNPK